METPCWLEPDNNGHRIKMTIVNNDLDETADTIPSQITTFAFKAARRKKGRKSKLNKHLRQ